MEQALAELVTLAHSRIDYDDDSFDGGYPYMRGRGVTDEQIRLFKLGIGPNVAWAPRELKDTPDGKKFNRQFRGSMQGQLVIPIYNQVGKLRGVETRLWEETEERRYSQYWLESWKEDAVFLGLPHALPSIWDTGVVFLVEGVFDFFAVQRVFPNTLSPLAARLMLTQYRLLRRFCRHVVFMFDQDKKGREFTDKALDRYNTTSSEGFMAHRLTFPAKDPSQLYENWGFARFERYLHQQADRLHLYL